MEPCSNKWVISSSKVCSNLLFGTHTKIDIQDDRWIEFSWGNSLPVSELLRDQFTWVENREEQLL